MCDARDCTGPALGRVVVDGTPVAYACSDRCAQRIGAPMTPAEVEANFAQLFDRVGALERAVLGNRPQPAVAPAASTPIAIVPYSYSGVPGLVDAVQKLVPDKSVVETPVGGLVVGQRAIVAVFSDTLRSPTGANVMQLVSSVTSATGRKPLVLVGVSDMYRMPEEWQGLDRVSKADYDGAVRFMFPGYRPGFKQWRDAPPTREQILGPQGR